MCERRTLGVGLMLALLWGCGGSDDPKNGPGKTDADGDASQDAGLDAAADASLDAAGDAPVDSGPTSLPRLGVYTVNVDGTDLKLLVDTGTEQLTHVRLGPSGWFTATRYTDDSDKNGLSMEGEDPHYGKTEVVVFQMSSPKAVTVIAGGTPAKLCANSSWTADGKLLYLHQDDPVIADRSRFKRATFSTIPTVASTAIVDVPPEVHPVDPHQWGPSDSTGMIVFPGIFAHPQGFMRPIWRMPASGTNSLAALQLVGCPICPANSGCCAFSTPDSPGTNDPTIHPLGTEVAWMQQHPELSFQVGPATIYPYRQFKAKSGGSVVDLSQPNTPTTTIQSYVQWRPDGGELVYWEIQPNLTTGVVKQPLFRMAPDGTARKQIPLPAELCTSHPSYLDQDTIVFSGWRCGGALCNCHSGDL